MALLSWLLTEAAGPAYKPLCGSALHDVLASAAEALTVGGGIPVHVKRLYDAPLPGDGHRLLVDGMWPRGASHPRPARPVGSRPATKRELRRWFRHDPAKFGEFRARYRRELARRPDPIRARRQPAASGGPITLVYAASDELPNNAVVLAEVLRDDTQGRFGPAC